MRSWERIAGIVGAIPLGSFVAPELAVNSSLISLQKKPRSRLIVVTIKQRSGHDRLAIGPRSWTFLLPSSIGTVRRVLEESWHWFHDERATIAARSHRDHGSIAPRSWISSTNLPNRPIASGEWTIAIARSSSPRSWGVSTARWQSTICWHVHRPMELQVSGRSRSHDQVGHDREERPPPDGSSPLSRCIAAVHASGWRLRSWSMTDEQRWRSNDSEPSTCRQVRPLISFT